MAGPQFSKMLCASTGHITYKDARLLDGLVESDNGESNPVCAFEKCPYPTKTSNYGWFIYVPCGDEAMAADFKDYGYSDALIGLLQFAEKHAAEWVNLDCDGPEIEELPAFVW